MRSLNRSPWRSLGARQEGTAQNAGGYDSSRHTGWAQRAVLQSERGRIPGPHARDGRGHRGRHTAGARAAEEKHRGVWSCRTSRTRAQGERGSGPESALGSTIRAFEGQSPSFPGD